MTQRLSKGPLQITSLDLPSINYMLQQIRTELDQLSGLRGSAVIYGDLNVEGDLIFTSEANTVLAFDADGNTVNLSETGTAGSVVLSLSPTIVTPTVASFVNATHTHQNAAGGGTLDHGLALTGLADDDHTGYVLVSNMEADRATIATRWDDLTDGGATTLHSHAGGGSSIDVEDEGGAVATASVLNFAGAGVVATDAGGGQVDVTISGGAGGGDWASVGSYTYSIDVTEVAFTGLAGYTEILVLIRGITCSGSVFRNLQVSIDNGATYLGTSGDYINVSPAGVESNQTLISFHATANTAARSGAIIIRGWDLTINKTASHLNSQGGTITVIPTTSDLDALRVFPDSGNITGGTIRVYGR